MLSLPIAHAGQPLAPHDIWNAWDLDPLLLTLLVGGLWLHQRGRARSGGTVNPWRGRAFVSAVAVVAVALVSPLDASAGSLASAHMVQHVLLVLVAAPLLAFSAPGSTLLRGAPPTIRRLPAVIRRSVPGARAVLAIGRDPAAVLLLYVGTLWVWHAASTYQAALDSAPVHALEHGSFLLAGFLFWRVVLSGRPGLRVPGGLGALLVFGAAMGSVLLAVLLTFAGDPWYAGYAGSTASWGIGHLADQHLAGVLMWVPAGAIHVVLALILFATWVEGDPASGRAGVARRGRR